MKWIGWGFVAAILFMVVMANHPVPEGCEMTIAEVREHCATRYAQNGGQS